MTEELKTNTISAAAEKTKCLLHFEVCLQGSLLQRVGAALLNDLAPECFLFVFSPSPKMLSEPVWPSGKALGW